MKAPTVAAVVALLLLTTFALMALDSQVKSPPAPVECGSVVIRDTTLSHDIGPCSGNGLRIARNGVALDCNGHTISGTGTNDTRAGINLTKASGVTVKTCNVSGFNGGSLGTASPVGVGFAILSSSGNTLTGNTANGNLAGFLLSSSPGLPSSSDNTLQVNTANGNGMFGFYLMGTNNNVLVGNTANSNGVLGFALSGSSGNTLIGNRANGNTMAGFVLDSSTNSNKLYWNNANGNTQYGYYDLSLGSGTKGTANFYLRDDFCRGNGVAGSSPSGLGTPQP